MHTHQHSQPGPQQLGNQTMGNFKEETDINMKKVGPELSLLRPLDFKPRIRDIS